MVQIIPENRKRTSTEKLLSGLTAALPGIQSFLDKNEALKNQGMQNQATQNLGIDPNLSPEMQKLMMQYQLMGNLEGQKGQNQLNLLNQKQSFDEQEKASKLQGEREKSLIPLQEALGRIDKMRSIGARGNLGIGSSYKAAFGGKTARDLGEYETLGKSLISMVSTIPIRNKEEFKSLAHNLYDPDLPDSQREGILKSLEDIIQSNMKQFMDNETNPLDKKGQKTQTVIQQGRQFDRRFQ